MFFAILLVSVLDINLLLLKISYSKRNRKHTKYSTGTYNILYISHIKCLKYLYVSLMSGTKESKKVKIILIYLKSDVTSTNKYGGYKQHEEPSLFGTYVIFTVF